MLDHAGVLVADLERSVRFYRDVLGLREGPRFSLGTEELVFLTAGDAWLELIYNGSAPGQGGVVDHVALRVADVEGMLRQLHARDVRVLDEQPLDVPPLRARIAFIEGPDGERIELIERR